MALATKKFGSGIFNNEAQATTRNCLGSVQSGGWNLHGYPVESTGNGRKMG